MDKKVIVLVPMKGHSERVPNKNMKDFNGKPLYHWIVNAVLASSYVKEVIINTDSDIIKNDAHQNFQNVRIINRPESLHGDFVSMNAIIEYDLQNTEGEYFMQTHSTNPLIHPATFNKAIETYFSNLDKCDSVFAVTKWQTRLYWEDTSPINHNPEELLRTQDLPPVFEENSNFYIFSKESFFKNKKRIGNKPMMVEVPKLEAIDIDNPEDFVVAELLHKMMNK